MLIRGTGLLLPLMALVLALAAGARTRADTIVFADGFENFPVGTDVTVTNWTPAVGPVNGADFSIFPAGSISTKTVVNYGGSRAVNANLPIGSGLEYLGLLPAMYDHTILKFDWDLTVPSLNSGLGGIWIRFPAPVTGMQILVGYLDDGTIGTFSGDPSLATLVPIGTFQSNQTHHTSLYYDLSASRYSVFVDAAPLLVDVALPAYLNQTNMDRFGFDANELFPTSQGNTWILDNIAVSVVPEPAALGLVGLGLLVGFRLLRRLRT